MDAVDTLNRTLHGSVNSVIQYIDIATPYVPPGYEEAQQTIRAMKNEETATANEITDLIGELDGVPTVGVFPYWNVDLNYLDLRFMARFAAQHQEKVVAELASELDAVRDDPRVYTLLSRVLEQKKAHLATLVEIGGSNEPEPEPEPEPAAEE